MAEYEVVTRLKYGEGFEQPQEYEIGSTVDINDAETAKELLARGVIANPSDVVGNKPVAEPVVASVAGVPTSDATPAVVEPSPQDLVTEGQQAAQTTADEVNGGYGQPTPQS